MGEISFIGTGETRGCLYPVCKKDTFSCIPFDLPNLIFKEEFAIK